ncbi:glycosyltransferase family 2 protein [Arcanobacterium buesumense]|uniref:Glycosyltransferase family 2 protein n=1 Tax=Arcanobacterium buesumense TaxID=2722751 RepID=A0A6H2EJG9_9ACTO|nr:glycosyltransferase family 2 protein [Arcanobacterium buesumense]QJC21113.1 glycosyltransferase family 2 protein [Arcanobacterium buesumense]
MLDTSPAIHVVTIAYNPGPELDAMVSSLLDAGQHIDDTPADLTIRLTIVDNGTEPARVDALAEQYGDQLQIRVLRPGENIGYGRAANLGLDGTIEPWVCVANPDTVFQPGSLARLVAAGQRWPQAGIFGPQLLESNGDVYPSARALPSIRNGIGHAVFAHIWPKNPWTRAYHGNTDNEHVAGWLSGACLVIRTQIWREIGGFDPHYFMFFEDVDLGRRAGEAGFASVYVPSAVVVHEQGASWKARPARMIHAHHNSAKQYLTDAYSAWYYAPLRAMLSAGLDVRAWWQTRGRD